MTMTQATGGHLFTQAQAAAATDRSLTTIKRMRADGRFPNSQRDARGVWLIPLADLLAAGLHLSGSEVTAQDGQRQGPTKVVDVGRWESVLERAARADALTLEVEHLRALVDRLTQPQIEAAPTPVRISDTSPPGEGEALALVDLRDEAPSRRWFRRR